MLEQGAVFWLEWQSKGETQAAFLASLGAWIGLALSPSGEGR